MEGRIEVLSSLHANKSKWDPNNSLKEKGHIELK